MTATLGSLHSFHWQKLTLNKNFYITILKKNICGIVRLSGLTLMMNTQINILKIMPGSFTHYATSSKESWKAQVGSYPPLIAEGLCYTPAQSMWDLWH